MKGLAVAAHEAKIGISKAATIAAKEAKIGISKAATLAKDYVHDITAPKVEEKSKVHYDANL